LGDLRRAFVAVVPPPSVREWVDAAARSAEPVAPALRWTRSEQRHLTVKFFGAVPDVDALGASLTEAVRTHAPFTLSLGGGGAFPSARRASVLWLGTRQGSDALGELAAPFLDDDRPFRAHLTLARVGKSRDLRDVIAALDACGESAPWTVDEVILFDSDTRADGAVHTEVLRFRLSA
jgi:2'-5' RNA ligase